METAVIIFSFVARLFAVASAVLGFIAEGKKLTPNDISYSQGQCVYQATPAFALGICAVSLLVAAQIMVCLAGSCSGHGGASGSKRIWGNVCYALSWVAAVIAAALYVQGVVWNAATTRSAEDKGLFVECSYLRFPVFTRAALLSLAATALGIWSYMMLRAQPAPAVTPSSAEPATAPPASGGPGRKPDASGEAIAIPVEEMQRSAPGYGPQGQAPLPDVPRHPVGGYGRPWNPPQSSRPPQREAQPAFEVMIA